jgi:hydroxymethylbilane synthase
VSGQAIRLGTRGSVLALRQADLVAERLRPLAPGCPVEIVPIRTSGDRLAHVSLAEFGGKGLFVKELEEALLDGRVDLAVHSLKDLPAELPEGLCLGAFPPRGDPRDVLVSRTSGGIEGLPGGARVGTGSLRRRVLLRSVRPDLTVETIRGNVDTRLRRLSEGAYDAIVVAAAGLERLGLAPENASPLDPGEFLPAVGQGILAVEARAEDRPLLELLRGVDHRETRWQAEAERAFLRRLGASCHTPVAAHARVLDGELTLDGLVASLDGRQVLRGRMAGVPTRAEALGVRLAEDLLARGAQEILHATLHRTR